MIVKVTLTLEELQKIAADRARMSGYDVDYTDFYPTYDSGGDDFTGLEALIDTERPNPRDGGLAP